MRVPASVSGAADAYARPPIVRIFLLLLFYSLTGPIEIQLLNDKTSPKDGEMINNRHRSPSTHSNTRRKAIMTIKFPLE